MSPLNKPSNASPDTQKTITFVSKAMTWLANRALPVSGGLSLLILWQFVIWVFEIRQFIVPSPLDVLAAFASDWISCGRIFGPR